MGQLFKIFLKSLFSDKALTQLYTLTRVVGTDARMRTKAMVGASIFLSVFLLSFLVSQTTKNNDPYTFVDDLAGGLVLKSDDLTVRFSQSITSPCTIATECVRELSSTLFTALTYQEELQNTPRSVSEQQAPAQARLVEFNVRATRNDVLSEPWAIFLLPRFHFDQATVFMDGQQIATALTSLPVTVPIASTRLKQGAVTVQVLLTYNNVAVERFVRWQEPPALFAPKSYAAYEQFAQARRLSQNLQVGVVARFVLAVFALLLFLIVDSSPESLGLALFMGFEAAAMAFGNAGMMHTWLPATGDYRLIQHICYSMSDILRLYYFLQMARVATPKIAPWFLWGILYSVPYALFRTYFTASVPTLATTIVWASRDVFVAGLGVLVCGRTLWLLRHKHLPWRTAALTLAIVATTAPLCHGLLAFFPSVKQMAFYTTVISLLNAQSSYLYCLSTFLNISTLENRVRTLSQDRVKTIEMEKDLELGRSVQQAFLKTPDLPNGLQVVSHQQAALYVSGDTYFVDWNAKSGRLTFLLNDVVGHGVSAALKAFASNIVARTLWEEATQDEVPLGTRLAEYVQRISRLIATQGDQVADFTAVVGAEFDTFTGKLGLYRFNYVSPLLIEPLTERGRGGGQNSRVSYRVRKKIVQHGTCVQTRLLPGSYIVLLSDGIIGSSRDEHSVIEYLESRLAEVPRAPSAESLKSMLLNWPGYNRSASSQNDDRTMIVFSWHPQVVAKQGSDSETETLPLAS